MNKKNLQIEGLRAIGLILILLFHFVFYISGGHLANGFDNMPPFVREWGLIGVGLFLLSLDTFYSLFKQLAVESFPQKL